MPTAIYRYVCTYVRAHYYDMLYCCVMRYHTLVYLGQRGVLRSHRPEKHQKNTPPEFLEGSGRCFRGLAASRCLVMSPSKSVHDDSERQNRRQGGDERGGRVLIT